MGSGANRPFVIAHRGACGYLPEHTLAAKALAFGMGADYLEQDVVATRDGELLVFHDLWLECVTDVASRFPGRARDDGHYYCIDFDLAEVQSLRLHERTDRTGAPVYPGRFPADAGSFTVPTLAQELRFINGLNRSGGRRVGIYPEIKAPAWHRDHGVELAAPVLDCLRDHGYLEAGAPVFLQCFDADELKRVRAMSGSTLPLVQLLNSRWDRQSLPLRDISGYADAVGLSLSLMIEAGQGGRLVVSPLASGAAAAGLAVHPYTLRADALPDGFGDFGALIDLLLSGPPPAGLFTDFPDLVRSHLDRVCGKQD